MQTESGSFALVTPAGITYEINATEHPVDHDWPDVIDPTDPESQHSGADIVEALTYASQMRAGLRPRRWDLEWEHGYGTWPTALV